MQCVRRSRRNMRRSMRRIRRRRKERRRRRNHRWRRSRTGSRSSRNSRNSRSNYRRLSRRQRRAMRWAARFRDSPICDKVCSCLTWPSRPCCRRRRSRFAQCLWDRPPHRRLCGTRSPCSPTRDFLEVVGPQAHSRECRLCLSVNGISEWRYWGALTYVCMHMCTCTTCAGEKSNATLAGGAGGRGRGQGAGRPTGSHYGVSCTRHRLPTLCDTGASWDRLRDTACVNFSTSRPLLHFREPLAFSVPPKGIQRDW